MPRDDTAKAEKTKDLYDRIADVQNLAMKINGYRRSVSKFLRGLDLEIGPESLVLDAGCGTGRVAIELARRGIDATGVDVDSSMIKTARTRGPEVAWFEQDLTNLHIGRTFDAVVMAGNVMLFTAEGQRTETTVSSPMAQVTRLAATELPEPALDIPGSRSVS
jgi:ubiquinone/menaquinone biosynthesis C-methylase UbiE